jgi:hypothetical protein
MVAVPLPSVVALPTEAELTVKLIVLPLMGVPTLVSMADTEAVPLYTPLAVLTMRVVGIMNVDAGRIESSGRSSGVPARPGLPCPIPRSNLAVAAEPSTFAATENCPHPFAATQFARANPLASVVARIEVAAPPKSQPGPLAGPTNRTLAFGIGLAFASLTATINGVANPACRRALW